MLKSKDTSIQLEQKEITPWEYIHTLIKLPGIVFDSEVKGLKGLNPLGMTSVKLI